MMRVAVKKVREVTQRDQSGCHTSLRKVPRLDLDNLVCAGLTDVACCRVTCSMRSFPSRGHGGLVFSNDRRLGGAALPR